MQSLIELLGSPSLTVLRYSLCGRKATLMKKSAVTERAQELCESRGGRLGLPVPNSPYSLCGHKATLKKKKKNAVKELRSCVKVEVPDVLSSPSLALIVPTVSVDVKQH